MNASSIEWLAAEDGSAGFTWNPVTGCTKVSAGCAHCYAATWAARQMGHWSKRRFEDVQVHAHRLDGPLRRRKPARIFVNSMSDLFHEDVPDDFIQLVFAVMAAAQRHTFTVLTKRPERARRWFEAVAKESEGWPGPITLVWHRAHLNNLCHSDETYEPTTIPWPLPNVILGVSVEDQHSADARIPLLLDTPAAVRAVSYEPAIGPADFTWLRVHEGNVNALLGVRTDDCASSGVPETRTPRLGWVIVGGESGSGARPFELRWARRVITQCRSAGVPVFVKQLGARPVELHPVHPDDPHYDQHFPVGLHDSSGGDPREWPEDLRVREFPNLNPLVRA